MSKQVMKKITILGDGAFGTACATVLAHNGHQVTLWCWNSSVADDIRNNHLNSKYLPDIQLSKNIIPTTSLEEALKNDIIFEAIPVQFMRSVLEKCKPFARKEHCWIALSKGIEQKTLLVPTEIVQDIFGKEIVAAAISGPSYAHELAHQQPTGVTIASDNKKFSEEISTLLNTTYFCTDHSTDLFGIQLVGALKNCVAIGVGLLEGSDSGVNTHILFMIRALEEIKNLLQKLGGDEDSLYGLAGIGDVVLTCFGKQTGAPGSRNHKFGALMGQGKNFEETIKLLGLEPEGVNTLQSLQQLAQKHNLTLPIFMALHEIVFQQKDVQSLIQMLCQ